MTNVKKNRGLWVQALRSGEYKQIKGELQNEGGHCCLGVLCDVWAKETGGSGYVTSPINGEFVGGVLDTQPNSIKNWVGLSTDAGDSAYGNSLAELNDEGVSFLELADIIESEPKGLFEE